MAKKDKLIVLGIESSCDETAASVISYYKNGNVELLSNIIHSQIEEHSSFGGIVPEIAARAHLNNIDLIVDRALKHAKVDPSEVNAVAVSCGPGLIGGLIVGSSFGKAFALSRQIPFIPINHLEGHILSPRLFNNIDFPYLALLVSGGHTQLILVNDIENLERVGTTLDDAAGETFDKAAIILNLGWPGGKAIEKAALKGNANLIDLPRPMIKRKGADFSFSGLKTALNRKVTKIKLTDKIKADFAASLQLSITEVIEDRCLNAMEIVRKKNKNIKSFILVGGVASNTMIRSNLKQLSLKKGFDFYVPPLSLCTDNAAMIAWAGIERILKFGIDNVNDYSFNPRPRWPLDPQAKAIGLAKEAR